jgi:hypothetical protein
MEILKWNSLVQLIYANSNKKQMAFCIKGFLD